MLHALRVHFENFGHTTKNKIFRLVKLLDDLSTMLYERSSGRGKLFLGQSIGIDETNTFQLTFFSIMKIVGATGLGD